MFYDLALDEFPLNSQFFFNILVIYISIPLNSDILPADLMEYWDLEHLTIPRPFVICISKDHHISKDIDHEVEVFPHCVIEVTKEQQVRWYEMIDYETETAWDLDPLLEDFDRGEE